MIYLLLETHYRRAKPLIREIMQLRHEVVWSQHPDDVLQLLQQTTFDLVIVAQAPQDPWAQDILLRLHEQGRKTPVLVLLEEGRAPDCQRLLRAGASACILQTLAPRVLHARVRALLQQFPLCQDAAQDAAQRIPALTQARPRPHSG
jgi:DNA-binding response OmpR family regulator